MLRRALCWVLVVVGAVDAVAYPALDLATGRGPQWSAWFRASGLLLFFLIGAYVFARRPDHPVSRRMLIGGVGIFTATTLGQLLSVAYLESGAQGWFWLVNAIQQAVEIGALVTFAALFAVFPDGLYHRSYERRAIRVLYLLPILIPALLLMSRTNIPTNPQFVWAQPPIASPIHLPALKSLGSFATALYYGRFTLFAIAAVLLVLRYRRFDAGRRLQVRWPLFSLFFVIPFGMGPVGYLFGISGLIPAQATVPTLGAVVMPTLPASMAVALFRPHLLDLELVIRRSVAYAALWLLIAVGYALLAAFVGVAATQRREVGVVVLVTILATLAFQPARGALERLASRLVYGERLSGFQAVSKLGLSLEEAASPEQAAVQLAAIVRQALDARWARVVIAGARPIAATDGTSQPTAAVLEAPLVYGEEVIGHVECGARSEGRYRLRDEELLRTLARHAALAIRNARLVTELADRLEQINIQAKELRASRARIVRAEEEGRRRLERDIHDGVQQELVSLLAKIRLVRNQVTRDPIAASALLEELQEETKVTLNDLRDLAQGIHPTLLSDRGLVEAIEDRISRMPAAVRVEVADRVRKERFTQAIEGAAYFTVCEALANAMKHASAQQLVVRLDADDGEILVEVVDDGAGFDSNQVARSGLSGLEDRLEALGGSLQVTSARGKGTRLVARLPARAASLV